MCIFLSSGYIELPENLRKGCTKSTFPKILFHGYSPDRQNVETAPSRCGYFARPNIDFVLQRQISKILSFVCGRRSKRARFRIPDKQLRPPPSGQFLCGFRFKMFYAKIQGLTHAVGRCCPLESSIDSALLNTSYLSFENSDAYKITVLRNQPAPETVKLFSFLFPRRFHLFKHFKVLY